MQIVKFTNEHLDDILKVEKECFSDSWSEKMFKEEISGKFSHYYVAIVDNHAVAYMGMWSLSGEGHITNIAVAKDYRRRGIAKALILHFIEIAKRENLEFMTLEVRASNSPAIALYKSFGFCDVGVRKNYYENKEDALLLTKFFGE
ncbi:MAG: ribosomal protein S18-alanine N-acetyltransferase [Clostridia bacterium]|nr:ribosomal protein S18-alanine N-acetyltransferase [Clostridia bacterium]